MEKTWNQTEIEKERLNGKIVMVLNILKHDNLVDRRGPRSTDYYEEKANCMEYSAEEVRNLDMICNMFDIGNMVYYILYYKKEQYLCLHEAKNRLIELMKERMQEVLATYSYPFDIIKHALPVKLKDDTKGICEENIENMFIIGVHSQRIYDTSKIMYKHRLEAQEKESEKN